MFDMVLTTCPFCGTGCNFYLKVLGEEIADVVPCKTHPVSQGNCVSWVEMPINLFRTKIA